MENGNSNRGAVVVVTGNVTPEQINAAANAAASAIGNPLADATTIGGGVSATLMPMQPEYTGKRRGRKPGRKPGRPAGSGRGLGRPPKTDAPTGKLSMSKVAIASRKRRREAAKARAAAK